jgi:UDP-2,3-diacylglucosamine pyrophosphatase LpxH
MKTVVLSDLHLGTGQGYDIFAGGEALPAFLDTLTREPTRVVLNGDTVDFLMNEDPLELQVARAVEQAQALVAAPSTAAVFKALGRVLAAGGEGVLRLGNHDVELALAEVQAVLRQALGQPPEVAQRLLFQRGDAPWVLEVGGARVLLAHGEQDDPWNKVDHAHLPGPGAPKGADPARYCYSAGSLLVKKLLNPLKRQYGLRFADLLMPDFQGALLAALAINPGAVRLAFQASSLHMGWQLLRRSLTPVTFSLEEAEPDLGLAERVEAAGLTAQELQAFERVAGEGPLHFSDDDPAMLGARQKLGRSALLSYAWLHRMAAGDAGEHYYRLAPTRGEWAEARRLAQKFQANAVLMGHTHAARWRREEDLLYVNSGTWIWLIRLPSPEAPRTAWADFLQELQRNPRLDPEHQRLARLEQRFTAVVCRPHAEGGAEVSLVAWQRSGLEVMGSTRVAPAAPRAQNLIDEDGFEAVI